MIIYRTLNYINGKIYVGQTKKEEALLNNSYKGSGKKLKRAFRKHGWSNFHTFVIKQGNFNQALTDQLEIHYIQLFNSTNPKVGYNIHPGGAYPLNRKGTKFTKKSRTQLSKSSKRRKLTNNHKLNISLSTKGKTKTLQHKLNISKGRKGIKFTTQHIKNLSKSHKNCKPSFQKAVVQMDLNNNIINTFVSAKEASRQTGEHYNNISACCNKTRSYTNKNFKWKFKETNTQI